MNSVGCVMSDSTCHVEAARDRKQGNWSIKRLCLSFGVCESTVIMTC